MATNWEIVKGGQGGSGPTWDSMSTSSTDEYEDLTEHYWEWTRDWELVGQFGYVGGRWLTKELTWGNTDDKWRLLNWEIITNTKKITGTE